MKHYITAIIFLIATTSYLAGCDSQNGSDDPLVGTYTLLDVPFGYASSNAGNHLVYVGGSLNLKNDGSFELVRLSREYERLDLNGNGDVVYSGVVGSDERIAVLGRYSSNQNDVTFVLTNFTLALDGVETDSGPVSGEYRGEYVSGIMLFYLDDDNDVDLRLQKN